MDPNNQNNSNQQPGASFTPQGQAVDQSQNQPVSEQAPNQQAAQPEPAVSVVPQPPAPQPTEQATQAAPQPSSQPSAVPQPPVAPQPPQSAETPTAQPAPQPVQPQAATPFQPAPQGPQAPQMQPAVNQSRGPSKSTTIKIIAGLAGLSLLGGLLLFAMSLAGNSAVASEFSELKSYTDDSGYTVQIPSVWEVKDTSTLDVFAVDPNDQTANVGMNISAAGKIPGYADLSDSEKDDLSVNNVNELETSLLSSFNSFGETTVIRTSTDKISDSDRSVYVEVLTNMNGTDFRVANAFLIFADGSVYSMNIVVPDSAWGDVEAKIQEIFNGFTIA